LLLWAIRQLDSASLCGGWEERVVVQAFTAVLDRDQQKRGLVGSVLRAAASKDAYFSPYIHYSGVRCDPRPRRASRQLSGDGSRTKRPACFGRSWMDNTLAGAIFVGCALDSGRA